VEDRRVSPTNRVDEARDASAGTQVPTEAVRQSTIPAGDRRLPIGVFASLTHLTHKALKTYERYGLLRPAHVDAETRYRFYALHQVRTAEIIRVLRTAGMPLRDIAGVLADEDTTSLAALLGRHREHLAAELTATDRLLHHLEYVPTDPRGGLALEIAVHDVPAHCALICAGRCTFETHETTVDRLLDRLGALTHAKALKVLERETATYFSDFDLTHDYRVEVSVPVDIRDDGRRTLPPSCCLVPAAKVAGAIHRGPYHEMSATLASLVAWVTDRNLPVTGEFSETYLIDERDTDDPDAYRTAIGLMIA